MANKASLKIFFELLLGPLNIPQSTVVPPYVFDAIYNVSSAWVIGKIVELWPKDQSYIDIIEPFLRSEIIQVKGGYIELPETYRNFLDVGAITNKSKTGSCLDCGDYEVDSNAVKLRKYNQSIAEGKCERVAIEIIDQTQWDLLTKDPFDKATYTNPKGCYFGERKIRICPADITTVELRYLVNEKLYVYGYIMQPDDTYIFNEATSVESEFKNPAFNLLYKAASTLLGVYFRDQNVSQFSQALAGVQFK